MISLTRDKSKNAPRSRAPAVANIEAAAERFRVAVEASPSAMLMVDADGVITLANKRTEQLFDYSREELIGQPIELLVPTRYRQPHTRHRADFMEYPTTRPMGAGRDLYGSRKDGTEVPIEIGLNPVHTDDGDFVIASIIDITERKRGEEQLLLQSTALECAANAIVITDVNGKILWVNRSFTESTGYEPAEVMGRNPRLLKSGKQDQAFYQNMWQTILAGNVWRDTIINRRKDGELAHEDLTITPIYNSLRQITHFVAIKQDISERRKAEEALRQSEERLQTVVENLAEGLVISELDGQLVHWNRAALEMHGFTTMEECLVQLPDFEQVFELRTPAGDLLKMEEWPLPRIIRGELLRGLEVSVRRIDSGIERIFSYGGQIVREPSGKRLAFVTITDITDRRRAEKALFTKTEELAMMTQQLWQASKLATVGELAASIAHELNNPLATISLRLETLALQLAADEQKLRAVEIVADEVDRMGKLVGNLLQFSRRTHQQISTLDVCEEIDSSFELIEYHLRSNRIKVSREYDSSVPTIQADRQQLRQVFLNLLTNASDAMAEGGEITARVMQSLNPKQVQIEFIDNGPGISEENLERVWDPFFTTKPEGKGTGLGLAICRRVVEEHRGSISIESSPGAGISVKIIFPATNNVSSAENQTTKGVTIA